jgi:hypothetical protein
MLNRFEVAHLTDEDDVGVLPHDVLKRIGKAVRIRRKLALINDTDVVGVHIFDRVFHRHDVAAPLDVDVMDHRGERCGLSRTRWTRNED